MRSDEESDLTEDTKNATGPRRWLKPLVGLGAAALLFAGLRWTGLDVAGQVTDFLERVRDLGVWAPVAYVAAYAVATVAFVPGSLLTLAGGALFGLVRGTLYVFVAATLGSGAAFLIARYLARDAIETKLEGNEKFAVIDRTIGRDGLKIVALLRLVPFFPFVWLNYGLGLTSVRFRDYLLGGLGMLPGTFLYVFYGDALGSLAALGQGAEAQQGAERWLLLGGGLVAAVAVTTLITRRARAALAAETRDASETRDAQDTTHQVAKETS